MAGAIAVLTPFQLKTSAPLEVTGESPAILDAILLEAAKEDMTEFGRPRWLLRIVEALGDTVPPETGTCYEDDGYFAEFEYRREPTTFLPEHPSRGGANNGKRQGTECNADALREFLVEHESGAGNLPVAGPTGGGVREDVDGSDVPALRGDAGGPDPGGSS